MGIPRITFTGPPPVVYLCWLEMSATGGLASPPSGFGACGFAEFLRRRGFRKCFCLRGCDACPCALPEFRQSAVCRIYVTISWMMRVGRCAVMICLVLLYG
jgi:hypothetical protein